MYDSARYIFAFPDKLNRDVANMAKIMSKKLREGRTEASQYTEAEEVDEGDDEPDERQHLRRID